MLSQLQERTDLQEMIADQGVITVDQEMVVEETIVDLVRLVSHVQRIILNKFLFEPISVQTE
jgi:hypothetical protein